MNLNKLINAFSLPKIPKNRQQTRRQNCKAAVTLSASGNVLLQSGQYKTAEDIARAKKKLKFL